MSTLPLATVRAQLSKLVDEASSPHERIEITRNGQRAAVLLGADDFDSLCETLAVLSDSELLQAHFEGLSALEDGASEDAAELEARMLTAGRLPGGK